MKREQRRGLTKLYIARFKKERDEVLRSLDPQRVDEFFRRFNPEMPAYVGPEVPAIMMHMARLKVKSFTREEKEVSRRWLTERGHISQ